MEIHNLTDRKEPTAVPETPPEPILDAPRPEPAAHAALGAFAADIEAARARHGIGDLAWAACLDLAPDPIPIPPDEPALVLAEYQAAGGVLQCGDLIRGLADHWAEQNANLVAEATRQVGAVRETLRRSLEDLAGAVRQFLDPAPPPPPPPRSWPNPFAPGTALHRLYAREQAEHHNPPALAEALAEALEDLLISYAEADRDADEIRGDLGLEPREPVPPPEGDRYAPVVTDTEKIVNHRNILRARNPDRWVVWSGDGLRILGVSCQGPRAASERALDSGEPPGQVEYVPPAGPLGAEPKCGP